MIFKSNSNIVDYKFKVNSYIFQNYKSIKKKFSKNTVIFFIFNKRTYDTRDSSHTIGLNEYKANKCKCMKPYSFFMNEETACKNEFTSECKLQTQTNKIFPRAKTPTYSLYCWPLVFYPDKRLVGNVPLRLSRRPHHLSMSSFNATASPSLPWWSAASGFHRLFN